MYKLAHPGEILRELYLEPLGLTVTTAAKVLGVTRKTLSELVNRKSDISISITFRTSLCERSEASETVVRTIDALP